MTKNSKQLFAQFDNAINNGIVWGNEALPEDYQDKVRGGRTLERLDQLCDKRDGLTQHRKDKATKASNIELYRQQIAAGQEIDWQSGEVNEDALYRNQMTMVKCMMDSGLLEDDDLE